MISTPVIRNQKQASNRLTTENPMSHQEASWSAKAHEGKGPLQVSVALELRKPTPQMRWVSRAATP